MNEIGWSARGIGFVSAGDPDPSREVALVLRREVMPPRRASWVVRWLGWLWR